MMEWELANQCWFGSAVIDANSDSDLSESEIEFHLYSQVHYASQPLVNHTEPDVERVENETKERKDYVKESGDSSPSKNTKKLNPVEPSEISGDILKSNENVDPEIIVISSEDTEEVSDNESNFLPEAWEIVDSVDSGDSDDENLDIHASKTEENASIDEWTQEESSRENWLINDRDKKIITAGGKNRYYKEERKSGMRCRNCDDLGHKARDCPEPQKQLVCFQCGIRGHMGRDCPASTFMWTGGRGQSCDRCGQLGHIKAYCPDIWRQFHMTTKPDALVIPIDDDKLNERVFCYNCANKGHFGHECEKRSSSFFSPITPLVFQYNKHELQNDLRQRLTSKRKEIKRIHSHGHSEDSIPKKRNEKKSKPSEIPETLSQKVGDEIVTKALTRKNRGKKRKSEDGPLPANKEICLNKKPSRELRRIIEVGDSSQQVVKRVPRKNTPQSKKIRKTSVIGESSHQQSAKTLVKEAEKPPRQASAAHSHRQSEDSIPKKINEKKSKRPGEIPDTLETFSQKVGEKIITKSLKRKRRSKKRKSGDSLSNKEICLAEKPNRDLRRIIEVGDSSHQRSAKIFVKEEEKPPRRQRRRRNKRSLNRKVPQNGHTAAVIKTEPIAKKGQGFKRCEKKAAETLNKNAHNIQVTVFNRGFTRRFQVKKE